MRQYVAATTSAYREAIDAATSGQQFGSRPSTRSYLTQSFSRGFTHGFLDGVNHQELVQGSSRKSAACRWARSWATRRGVILCSSRRAWPSEPGDGIVFDEGHPEQDEQGGRVYGVPPGQTGCVELRFGPGASCTRHFAGEPWSGRRMIRPSIASWQQTYSRDVVAHREKLSCSVRAVAGDKLFLTLTGPRRADVDRDGMVPWRLRGSSRSMRRSCVSNWAGWAIPPTSLGEVHLHRAAPRLIRRNR